MVNKIIVLSLFLMVACGPEVQVSTKKLQESSNLSDGSVTSQAGILKRGTPDVITTNGATHPVSMYSSYQALEFIAAKPMTTQMSVKFKGKVKNNEMVLELIQ